MLQLLGRVAADDLVAVQAYVLWEHAGKPQGADFSDPARREIQGKLKEGKSFEEQVGGSLA
jgi:alpha-glucan,water dikinase